MKKLIKMIGIIAFTAIVGFSLVTCDLFNKDDEDGNSPDQIIGTWNGSLSKGTGASAVKYEDVTIVFTSSDFTLTSGEGKLNITGTWSKGSGTLGTTEYTLKSGNTTIGTATILLTLTFTGAINSDLASFTGSDFKKEYTPPSTDPFNAKYTGSMKKGTSEATDVVLEFKAADNSWTLKSTTLSIDESGTFTKSGLTATLVKGNLTLFTANYSVLNSKITLSGMVNTDYAGSTGSLTKSNN